MKVRLLTRLFLAILLSILVPLGAMMFSVQWSFREGFADYLHQQKLERTAKVIPLLVAAYQEHGDWEFLRDDHFTWVGLLHRGLGDPPNAPGHPPADDPPPGPPHGRPPHPPHLPPPPRDPFARLHRIYLQDAEHQRIIGPPPDRLPGNGEQQPASTLPIEINGQTVGWLEVERSTLLTDRLAVAFVAQQTQVNRLILLLAFLIASLAGWLLAGQILRPLRRIAAGTRTLASGRYDVALPVSGDELGDLARDFNRLAATLQSHENARRRWIADISHELRTPLAILRGEIESLLDGVRPLTRERIASLHAETLALNALVNDLYELSLSDLGALSYRRVRIDLVNTLTRTAGSYRTRFAEKAITLTTRFEGPAIMLGDPQRLAQLFGNVLENSYRYTHPGGQCRLTLASAGERAVITIEDSAPGVPPEALGKLFDRLYRVDASRSREHGGAGLGLSICTNIVAAHEGTITASHSPLGGLAIQIELPLSQERDPHEH